MIVHRLVNMSICVDVSFIAPLTWYQSIMVNHTVKTFDESETLMMDLLQELNLNFNPQCSLYYNLLQSGSIGYNYILSNAIMTRTGFALENHGITEKYAILVIENGNIVNISSYYSNTKQEIEIVKRRMSTIMSCNYHIFTTCLCSKSPKDVKSTLPCFNCVNQWKPQNHSFYPELLSSNTKIPTLPINLLM